MARRSSRQRMPTGRRRRGALSQVGIVLLACGLIAVALFLVVAIFQGLGSAHLPKGLGK